MRIIGISLAFLACTQLYGQERFYNFIDGWVSNYSVELEDRYFIFGRASDGSGSSDHKYVYYNLGFGGVPIDSSYFEVEDAYTTTTYSTSSVALVLDDQLLIAGYSGDLEDIQGRIFLHDFGTSTEILFPVEEGLATALFTISNPNDSTFYVSGLTTTNLNGGQNLFVKNLDLSGEERWSFEDDCGQYCQSLAEQVLELDDGGIVILFSEYDNSFPNQEETLRTVLLKLDAQGEEEWRRYPGDWEDFHINPGGIVGVGNEILVSYSDPYFYNADAEWEFNDSCSISLAFYNQQGDLISEADYLYDMLNNLESARIEYDVSQMQVLEDGDILISGSTGPGGLLMRITPDGEIVWYREILWHPLETQGGFSQQGFFYHVQPTSDGGFLATGEQDHSPSVDYPFNFQKAIAVKLDEYGCLEPGCQLVDGIEEYPSGASGAALLNVWPNPTTGKLRVEIPKGIKASDIESAEVRDELGRKVYSGFKDGGLEYGVLDLESLPTGVYFLQLVTSERVYSAKIIKEQQ